MEAYNSHMEVIKQITPGMSLEDMAAILDGDVCAGLVFNTNTIPGQGNYPPYGYWIIITNDGTTVTIKTLLATSSDFDLDAFFNATDVYASWLSSEGNGSLLALQMATTTFNVRAEQITWICSMDSMNLIEQLIEGRQQAEALSTADAEAAADIE